MGLGILKNSRTSILECKDTAGENSLLILPTEPSCFMVAQDESGRPESRLGMLAALLPGTVTDPLNRRPPCATLCPFMVRRRKR